MPSVARLAVLVSTAALASTLLFQQASAAGTVEGPMGVWPLRPAPEVVRRFDPPSVVWGAGHRGVDLLGTPGQAVRAALPGSVTFAGMLAGRGVVVVSHGDTRTTYEPVLATLEVGTVVTGGAVIGTLALPGTHCPPRACLHWGWRRGDTYLDPLTLVGAGEVRLLPLWRPDPVDVVAPQSSRWPVTPLAWLFAYAEVAHRLSGAAILPPRAPQARGCACW